MRPALLALPLPLLLGFASPPPLAPAAIPVTIDLSNYRFDPATISLRSGQAYVLRLVNASRRDHNFVAPAFLRAAGAGRDAIEVPRGRSVDVAIVAPAAGRFALKCTHFTHAMRGMKGTIIVD